MLMSGLVGSKRSIYSLAPTPYVGPANKRLNLGNSSHVGIGQPYPYPIDIMTRRNILDGWTPYNVTTYNGYACVMPDLALKGKSSIYLEVTRYPGQFEAFVWDNWATGEKPKTAIDASRYSGGLEDVVKGFVYGQNDRCRDAELVVGQNPSFPYNLHESTPAIDASRYSGGLEDIVRGFEYGGNDRRRDAEPVLGQNPSFSYDLIHESTPATDALMNYSGGLEDVIRGFKFGGNDRRRDAEAVLGQKTQTRRWRIEELRRFLENDTDEGSEQRVEENHNRHDTDKPLLHQNPSLRDLHQTGRSCFGTGTTNPPKFLKNEFGEHRVGTDELLHQNPSHPNFHQIETSYLESGITTLPLDECNYCGGVEDLMKTPFDEIIDGMNLVSGDEVIMTTEFGFLSDLSINDLFHIGGEISHQVDWDELLSDDYVPNDDWSEGNEDESLPFPSNNIIEIPEVELLEFGALDGWLNDFINGRVPLP